MTSQHTERQGERIRILHAIDSLGPGGTELVSAALIGQTEAQFDHAVCALRGSWEAGEHVARLTVPVTFLGKRRGHDWGLALRIARLCLRLRPHVVHARNWGTIDAVIGARLAGVPVVIHSEHGREHSDVDGAHRARLRVRRALGPFIDLHVVVSAHLQRWLLDSVGVRAEKVRIVRNGVDTTRFAPLRTREAVRAQHGYAATDLVFGCLGRLAPVKDHRTLLEAFDVVAARHPHGRLLCVGDGPERAPLEQEVRRRGLAERVQFVGHRDDVAPWLGMMDVFVHASLMEGMSNAILEAMAVGVPVVATSVGGTPEIVEAGVTGRLVPAVAPAALADAMLAYSGDDALRMAHGAAGRARAETHFPLPAMIAGYTAVYRDALARRGRTVELAPARVADR